MDIESYINQWVEIADKACKGHYSKAAWDSEDYLQHVGYRLWTVIDKAGKKGLTVEQLFSESPVTAVAVLFDSQYSASTFWTDVDEVNFRHVLNIPVKTNRNQNPYWKLTFMPEILSEIIRGASGGVVYYLPVNYTVKEYYAKHSELNFEAAKVWMTQAVHDLSGGGIMLSKEGENILYRWRECLNL